MIIALGCDLLSGNLILKLLSEKNENLYTGAYFKSNRNIASHFDYIFDQNIGTKEQAAIV